MASPADVVDEGLPAAQAVAAADSQLAGDLETAAGGEPTDEPTDELSRLTAATDTRAHASDVLTVGQRAWPDPGSGSAAVKSVERPPHRGGTMGVWIRRHRLPVLALACMAVAAAATIPFVPTSPSHSSRPPNSSRPPKSSRPSSPPSFSRLHIDLSSRYKGLISSMAFSPSSADPSHSGGRTSAYGISPPLAVSPVSGVPIRSRSVPMARSWPPAIKPAAETTTTAPFACGTSPPGARLVPSPTLRVRARFPSRSAPTARPWPPATTMAVRTCGMSPPGS